MKKEEDNVAPLLEALELHMDDIDYALILVDDGSTDHTVNTIKDLASPRVKLLIFNKNYCPEPSSICRKNNL